MAPTETPKIAAPLAAELAEIASSVGCELIHIEFKGGTLRLILDKLEGGVDLSDCERVSKLSSAALDLADFGRGRYTLEVSSPGLDRELYSPRDYARFVGHRAKVSFRQPETQTKRTVSGRLAAFREEGDGLVEVFVEETQEHLSLSLPQIIKAKLEIEL